MKTKKIFSAVIAVILVAVMFMGTVSAADYESFADDLKGLGLFKGTDSGYELDRAPTRDESATLLVRLLGKEAEALANNYGHPFTDVPNWANPYVGYLYEKGLTKGISKDLFGAKDLCTAQQFSTFVLRALGYVDTGDGEIDFTYDGAVAYAERLGLIDEELVDSFTRDGCVYVMYMALFTEMKGTDIELVYKLYADGAFDESAFTAFMGDDDDDELGDLSKILSSIDMTNFLMEAEFKIPDDEQGTLTEKMNVTVVGGNAAIEVTTSYMDETETTLMYIKDGFLYMEMYSMKLKMPISVLEGATSDVTDMYNVEQMLGDYVNFDDMSGYSYNVEITTTSAGVSYKVTIESDEISGYVKITTGDNIKINFPDLSQYMDASDFSGFGF